MGQIQFQILFLLIFIIGVGYGLRKSFYGTEQRVFGAFVPRPIIMGAVATLLGLFLWIIVNILILRFG